MPNWKKLVVSGSDAHLNSLSVAENVTASSFTGSFIGDGSGLENLPETVPGGSTGQIQFNSGSIFEGDSGLVYDQENTRVGINKPNPESTLDVSGSVQVTGSVGITETYSGSNLLIGSGHCNTLGTCATIAGGCNNTASEFFSTVSGGGSNTASGNSSTISGGRSNTASGFISTVSGGLFNNASGGCSTVSGGLFNTANGDCSGILGGVNNHTCGFDKSFIVGSDLEATAACYTFVNNLCNVGGGTSDCRLKENIQPLSYGIGQLSQLQPVSFNFKDDASKKTKYGFLAQCVQEVLPELIYYHPKDTVDGDPVLQFDKEAIWTSMINAIKELQEQNQQLTERVNKLETKN